MGGQRHAPAALTPGERLSTHCTGDWVGPRVGLDGCGKSRPYRDLNPGPSSPQHSRSYQFRRQTVILVVTIKFMITFQNLIINTCHGTESSLVSCSVYSSFIEYRVSLPRSDKTASRRYPKARLIQHSTTQFTSISILVLDLYSHPRIYLPRGPKLWLLSLNWIRTYHLSHACKTPNHRILLSA